MLAPWSLSQKSAKKRLAWWLYQQRDLMSASALHATSKAELEDCRRAGYRNAIAVIANGTDLPPASGEDLTSAGQRSSAGPVRTVLCLSRIHPVKGIALLIQAWARLRPAGWRLLIAGRDEGSHSVELTRLIADHGLYGSVEMVGAVDGDAKWTLIRSADLFVLPSHSESFGMVVAEALACEVPVITTRGTPWAELEEARCGWWIDRGVDPLTVALQRALDLPAADRRQMGVRGRQLIETRFTWNAVAREMAAFYERCLNPQSTSPHSLADCRR